MINASGSSGDWVTHGLNYSEDRYSELNQINDANIDSLGLVWTLPLGNRRGIEATPLVVDGIMYLTGPWSKVYAVDTGTGQMIWDYNPEVPGYYGPKACCDMDWRFYTVPGNPAEPFESPAMEAAVETWTGEWWKYGGGGTAWDAMAFDPELNLLYVGNGNGSPWNRVYRSPGGGDNLYLSSIVALNPDDGSLVWYYQTTPGDTWDYTATQHIILADMEIEGVIRKVLMQAPKNGFFYVLDRESGELLSADPYTYVNWATHVDLETGKPMETRFSRYQNENAYISPNFLGGHNWQPMAFNKITRMVYIPSRENAALYGQDKEWIYKERGLFAANDWNLGVGFDPDKPLREDKDAPANMPLGMLIAWDPVDKEVKWRVNHQTAWNAGVLTTAGGLVFQGTAEGQFVAYMAGTGEKIWETSVGSGVIAPPVTYLVDGKQYLSLAVGWGGAGGLDSKNTEHVYPGIIYTFAIGGTMSAPQLPEMPVKVLIEGEVTANSDELEKGKTLFELYCTLCHGSLGSGGGALPDLAFSSDRIHENFKYIVQGSFVALGMPNFNEKLTEEEIDLIQQHIFSTAEKLKEPL